MAIAFYSHIFHHNHAVRYLYDLKHHDTMVCYSSCIVLVIVIVSEYGTSKCWMMMLSNGHKCNIVIGLSNA